MRYALASLVAVALAAGPARAAFFTVTFTDLGTGNVTGSALLNATPNGDGTFTAVSGSGTVTVLGVTDAITLIANPSAPGSQASPSGSFLYDDQLLLGQDPLLTTGGLLFSRSGGIEVNVYSNGPGSYTYHEFTPGVGLTVEERVTFTLTPAAVPEPASLALLGSGLVGLVGYARRRKATV